MLCSDVPSIPYGYPCGLYQRAGAAVLQLLVRIWLQSSSGLFALLRDGVPVYEGWRSRDSFLIDKERGFTCQACGQIFDPARLLVEYGDAGLL